MSTNAMFGPRFGFILCEADTLSECSQVCCGPFPQGTARCVSQVCRITTWAPIWKGSHSGFPRAASNPLRRLGGVGRANTRCSDPSCRDPKPFGDGDDDPSKTFGLEVPMIHVFQTCSDSSLVTYYDRLISRTETREGLGKISKCRTKRNATGVSQSPVL